MANINFSNITVHNQFWKNTRYFSYEKTSRPYDGICYIVSGIIKYKIGNKEITAESGDVVILKKDMHYRSTFPEKETQDILINFTSCGEAFFGIENDIILIKSRSDLQQTFFDALAYDRTAERKCMVKSILFKITDRLCNPKFDGSTYSLIKQAVDDDFNFALRETDFAKICSVSVSTLQRTFKKSYGKTLSEYRSELRIARAKELLITKKYSMDEISELLGYCDSSHFCKCFKKSEGIPPKEFVKMYYTM